MSWLNVGDRGCFPEGSCILSVLCGWVMNGLPNMALCLSSLRTLTWQIAEHSYEPPLSRGIWAHTT